MELIYFLRYLTILLTFQPVICQVGSQEVLPSTIDETTQVSRFLADIRQTEAAREKADSLYKQALTILQTIPEPNPSDDETNLFLFKESITTQVFYLVRHKLWSQFKTYCGPICNILLRGLDFSNADNGVNALTDSDAPPGRDQKLSKAVKLLSRSIALGSIDASYLWADMNFFGNYTYPQNFSCALESYESIAKTSGDASSQFMTGLIYSTGMFGAIEVDQAKASLYYNFAAKGGDMRAQMALGFRHLSGIATPTNAQIASLHYKSVAQKAIEYYKQGPPGGRHLPRGSWIIPDEQGGLYGEGASDISSGSNAQERKFPSGVKTIEEALEYFHYQADENNAISAQFALSMLYYDGGKSFPINYELSLQYARKCASRIYKPDGQLKAPAARLEEVFINYGSHCAGILGQRYLRGEGVEPDFNKAYEWFQRGAKLKDYISQNGLGFMLYNGIGVARDEEKAYELLMSAVERSYSPALLNLGKIHLARGDINRAYEAFDLAARHSNIEAWYLKANYLATGLPDRRKKSFEDASVYYKLVAERVEMLHSPLEWAHRMYKEGRYEQAKLGFLVGAEQGYETAQMNLAYMLDRHHGKVNIVKPKPVSKQEERTALVYLTRCSKQLNIDAIVRMGDYYFNGIGTDVDYEKAAACYQAGADNSNSLARWNLGWMHENGIGVEQDFHLAKRFYDLSSESSPEAFLPVTLSLLKLRIRGFWNSVSGGKVQGIIEDARPKKTAREYWDQFWKQWNEMESKWEDEFVQDDFDHEQAEEDELEDVLDSFLVLALLVIFGLVVWYRQRQQVVNVRARLEQERRQLEERRRQEQQRPEQQDQHPFEEPINGDNLPHNENNAHNDIIEQMRRRAEQLAHDIDNLNYQH